MVFSPTTVTGTAVLEYGPTEILPQVGALSKHAERLCRPSRQASRAPPRGKPGFWTFESGCGRKTDSLLEGSGFEPSVPLSGRCVLKTVPTDPRLLPRERKPTERDRGFECRSLQRGVWYEPDGGGKRTSHQ